MYVYALFFYAELELFDVTPVHHHHHLRNLSSRELDLKSPAKKQPAKEILSQIPEREEVSFGPLKMQPHSPPRLHLPAGIDIDDSYRLLLHFIPEDL